MTTELKHNTPEAIDFLRWYIPNDSWTLVAIIPDGKTETETFDPKKPGDAERCAAWIESRQGKRNLYYQVNKTRLVRTTHKDGTPYESKPGKEHTLTLRALHVDLDPRAGEEPAEEYQRALKLLKAFNPPPSAIIASGGGVNALWKLAPRRDDDKRLEINGDVAKAQELEAYNIQLEKVFQADHCHNVDRILRLPGTINLPTATKIKRGRKPTVAELIDFNDHVYTLDQFKAAPRANANPTHGELGGRPKLKITGNVPDVGTDELRAWAAENGKSISDHCLALIATGQDPLDPTKYPSRSEALFKVCCDLVRAEVPDEMIFAVITGSNEIAASVRDKPNWEGYALRQIERAHEEAIDPWLRKLNEKHAVIADWGGRCRIISEVWDPAMKRTKISKQSFEDFRNRYRHIKVVVGHTEEGKPIEKAAGAFWIDQPQRRQYETLTFAPGKEVEDAYNLWAGFAFSQIPGDKHESFLRHVRDNVCSGNEECYRYLLGWMARLVQHPDEPGHVAVVIRGKRGTGKSFFAKKLGDLFGRHFLQVSDSKHLVGSFNAHLRDTVLLFGDEAFWAGDKKHESVLKTLITEEHLVIEGKGVDAEAAANFVHLIVASNEDWVVPAALEGERRFFVMNMGEEKTGAHAYFAQIQADLDQGGYESLLHFLMTYDLSAFEVRKVPDTKAAHEQKLHSLGGVQAAIHTLLMDGMVPTLAVNAHAAWPKWKKAKPGDLFINWYVISKFMRDLGYTPKECADKTTIGAFLTKLAGQPLQSPSPIPRESACDENGLPSLKYPLAREYPGRVAGYLLGLKEWRELWDKLHPPGEEWPVDEPEETEELPLAEKPPF